MNKREKTNDNWKYYMFKVFMKDDKYALQEKTNEGLSTKELRIIVSYLEQVKETMIKNISENERITPSKGHFVDSEDFHY